MLACRHSSAVVDIHAGNALHKSSAPVADGNSGGPSAAIRRKYEQFYSKLLFHRRPVP